MSGMLFGGTENLKGVGKTKAEKYKKLGITSVYDLICHFPKNYLDFHRNVPIQQALINNYNCLKLRIKSKSNPQAIRDKLVICKAIATDGTDDITIVMFNNVAAFNYLRVGYEYYMYGKVTAVFPLPTSPCKSLFIGTFLHRSSIISEDAFFWSSVSSNGSPEIKSFISTDLSILKDV